VQRRSTEPAEQLWEDSLSAVNDVSDSARLSIAGGHPPKVFSARDAEHSDAIGRARKYV
jgi:hypothetical protein